jgi:hypothetical protein
MAWPIEARGQRTGRAAYAPERRTREELAQTCGNTSFHHASDFITVLTCGVQSHMPKVQPLQIRCHPSGFALTPADSLSTHPSWEWRDVNTVLTYKRDLCAMDLICLGFATAEGTIGRSRSTRTCKGGQHGSTNSRPSCQVSRHFRNGGIGWQSRHLPVAPQSCLSAPDSRNFASKAPASGASCEARVIPDRSHAPVIDFYSRRHTQSDFTVALLPRFGCSQYFEIMAFPQSLFYPAGSIQKVAYSISAHLSPDRTRRAD